MAAALAHQANPSSIHRSGRAARASVERARRAVASVIRCESADVVLTSGGTEACNLALASAAVDVALTTIEHPAVARAAERITRATGSRTIPLAPATLLEDLHRALDGGARFVAVQWVNHETGHVLPVEAIAEACRIAGATLLVDATQALGKLPIDITALPVDFLALSSGKVGGPVGVGALYVRRGVSIDPLIVGSQDERGRRAGSVSPIAMAGFAAALEALDARLGAQPAISARRDTLEQALVERGAVINHDASVPRVATVTNVSVRGWRGPLLVAALDVEGLEASSGAACSSGLDAPSPVVRALYPDEPWRAESALRLSLGPETSESDVARAIEILELVLRR